MGAALAGDGLQSSPSNLDRHFELNVTQSRVSELANGKIEKFTLDAMMDMLDKLGFRTSLTLPSNDAGSPPQIVISQAPDA